MPENEDGGDGKHIEDGFRETVGDIFVLLNSWRKPEKTDSSG